jgi:hypothetical protein
VTGVSGDGQPLVRTTRDATEWRELLMAVRSKWERVPGRPTQGPLLPGGMTEQHWLDLDI